MIVDLSLGLRREEECEPPLDEQARVIQVPGVNLTYLDTGGMKPAVLLLHGGYLSHRVWQHQLPVLRDHYRVIAPDLRAHGRSGRAGRPYSVEQFAWDVAALLEQLAVTQVHACGHSLGGMVALHLALLHPGAVRSLVLAETSYGTRSTRWEALFTDTTRLLFRLANIRWLGRVFARSLAGQTPGIFGYVEEELSASLDDPESFRAIWNAVISFDARSRLGGVRQPTLVIVGERNRRTHAQGRVFARLLPNARHAVLPGAGHLLMLDRPQEFTALVLNFLASQEEEPSS